MANKIIAWTWLIMTIIATINWLMMPNEEYWFLSLVYMIGNIYLFIKYLESLKK